MLVLKRAERTLGSGGQESSAATHSRCREAPVSFGVPCASSMSHQTHPSQPDRFLFVVAMWKIPGHSRYERLLISHVDRPPFPLTSVTGVLWSV